MGVGNGGWGGGVDEVKIISWFVRSAQKLSWSLNN